MGSGEYLPVMQDLEEKLLRDGVARGKKKTYIQLATAAGQEDEMSLTRWKELGRVQAERLGAECIYLPVHNREDALTTQYEEVIRSAGLIYFSGGDPHYLADTLKGTPVWSAIEEAWKSGTSLGGCSAGAMAFGGHIISIRRSHIADGLNLFPNFQVIPHYDKFLGWLPDRIAASVMSAKEGVFVLGIDENTALVRPGGEVEWQVWGERKVHLLKGRPVHSFVAGEGINFS